MKMIIIIIILSNLLLLPPKLQDQPSHSLTHSLILQSQRRKKEKEPKGKRYSMRDANPFPIILYEYRYTFTLYLFENDIIFSCYSLPFNSYLKVYWIPILSFIIHFIIHHPPSTHHIHPLPRTYYLFSSICIFASLHIRIFRIITNQQYLTRSSLIISY